MKNIVYIFLIILVQAKVFAGNNDKLKGATKHVSGKIITTQGEELAGVALLIKETNQTFFADLAGNFSLELATDKVYSISVQTLGYAPTEVKSSDLNRFSEIVLKEQ